MKKEKMLRSMELIDEKYIAEAEPQNTQRKPKRSRTKLLVLAAAFAALLTTLSLWLFIPFSVEPPDVSRYADSEYYPIIQKLNAVTYTPPAYKNNFDMLINTLWANTKDDMAAGDALGSNMSGDNFDSATYHEVTDNQVAGVIEADLIKRSDQHIYYLFDGTLYVYSINGFESEAVGSYSIPISEDASYRYTAEWAFYLSADCKTVTVISSHVDKNYDAFIRLISLDVSDPTDIHEKKSVSVSGSYLSSRVVNGSLLLISEFYVGKNIDFSDEANFIPQIDSGNGRESIPMSDIISPETLTSPRYTVVCKLDEASLAIEGASAFLSYSEEVYVSTNTIYATRGYNAEKNTDGIKNTVAMTEISGLSYADAGLEQIGSVAIEGYVKDQYSLDEYNGLLRVVTTTARTRTADADDRSSTATSASLYCIDLSTLKVVAEVRDFAPMGEIVQSVRFDGDAAYVCTSVQLTDPVFFFDLSDLSNITYKDTGTIEGFSSSLVNFGEGYLLGIGVGGSTDTIKIEIYEETADGVRSVCKYEVEHAYMSSDYKSYYIDRENRLIGFGLKLEPYYYSGAYNGRYLLLSFNDYELHPIVNEALSGENDFKRGVYIDEYFYMFGAEGIKVAHIG